MTDPHRPIGDDPDRVPSQAELDAQDLAEMELRSADRDRADLYPKRVEDPGPPPRALVVDARVAMWGAAACALIVVAYGIANLPQISDLLRARLLEGAQVDPRLATATDRVESFARNAPLPMLLVTVLLVVGEYLFLRAIATHHSRNCRNFFLAMVAVNLLCIPIGLDLLFRYDALWSGIVIIGWLQFAFLLVAAVMTVRRSVNTWLPESIRMRPSRMFKPGP
ncbi:hypothetical protein GCM10009624_29640 [Gordonia sinesedis]